MGCDYFISRSLELMFIDGSSEVEYLKTSRNWYEWHGYLPDNSDYSDDEVVENFTILYRKYIEYVLTPRKNRVIYENSNFTKEIYKEKYSKFLSDNIVTIVMKETRTC